MRTGTAMTIVQVMGWDLPDAGLVAFRFTAAIEISWDPAFGQGSEIF